jgi:hypothetical protein
VRGERGQQDVLLDAEVMRSVLAPEREEAIARRSNVAGRGPAEVAGGDERDMVVAGERPQRGMALHATIVTRSSTRPSSAGATPRGSTTSGQRASRESRRDTLPSSTLRSGP